MMIMSVHLYVHMYVYSVCLSAYTSQKPHIQLHKIFCTCYVWPWLGPPLTTMQYVVYLQFCELSTDLSSQQLQKQSSSACIVEALSIIWEHHNHHIKWQETAHLGQSQLSTIFLLILDF